MKSIDDKHFDILNKLLDDIEEKIPPLFFDVFRKITIEPNSDSEGYNLRASTKDRKGDLTVGMCEQDVGKAVVVVTGEVRDKIIESIPKKGFYGIDTKNITSIEIEVRV